MKITLLLAVFLGSFSLILLMRYAFIWWKARYGANNALLNERINFLVNRATETDGTPSIFKEPLFSDSPEFNNFLKKFPWAHKLNDLIIGAGSNYSVHNFLMIFAGFFLASFIVAMFMAESMAVAFYTAVLSSIIPFVLLKIQKSRRKAVIERQLPDMIDFIGRSLSAGHSFPSALQAGALQSPEPLATQFRLTYEQLNFGVALKDVMADLVKRLETEEVRFFAIAVVLNREVGGNLTTLLADVTKLMRQRLTAKLVIRSLTSEGRSTAMFLGVLPIVMALLMQLIHPGYFDPVLQTSAGIKLYLGTALWAGVGFLLMRSIISVRV